MKVYRFLKRQISANDTVGKLGLTGVETTRTYGKFAILNGVDMLATGCNKSYSVIFGKGSMYFECSSGEMHV